MDPVTNTSNLAFTQEELRTLVSEYATRASFEEALAAQHAAHRRATGVALDWIPFQQLANALLTRYPDAVSALNKSPVEICGILNAFSIFFDCVPLPDPGAPKKSIFMFLFSLINKFTVMAQSQDLQLP